MDNLLFFLWNGILNLSYQVKVLIGAGNDNRFNDSFIVNDSWSNVYTQGNQYLNNI